MLPVGVLEHLWFWKTISGREADIQTAFDWDNADFYRYTPAMLHGTRMEHDFYPPSKQLGGRYKSEHF